VLGTLFDTSVWLAATFDQHPAHRVARQALREATATNPAVFCRATQQSYLRLISTAALVKAYGVQPLTNKNAMLALDQLQALPQVAWQSEPAGVFEFWRRLAALESASPKVWMDAYLAAFAMAAGLRLLTLDKDFKSFTPIGLNLALLSA
jgi:toxin-antitoxin system PIN domain toxin